MWAATSPGGISGRVDAIWNWTQGKVETAVADPQLRRAENVLDAWYERHGAYPDEATFSDSDPQYALPIGVRVELCSARAVVLSGVTGRGRVSRLLVDGERVGDVDGAAPCPIDLERPSPWV